MAPHQGRWPVAVWCEVLPGSRRGFYASGQRQTPRCRRCRGRSRGVGPGDRGSPYACGAHPAWLAEHGIHCRMSPQGDGFDKAVAERFFGSLRRKGIQMRFISPPFTCPARHHDVRGVG